jgi:hypothetical protein
MPVPVILLDAGVLWLAVHPSGGAESVECQRWMATLANKGYEFGVAEITDYETRRKLMHQRKNTQLNRLDLLASQLLYLPITTAVMRRAAYLWADVRWRGWPTADPKALDADVILGAQWESLRDSGRQAIVATTNVGHLRLVSDAETWQSIQ